MEKRYAVIPKELFDGVVVEFARGFSLPEIQRKFTVYAYDMNDNQLNIRFVDQKCDVKYVSVDMNKEPTIPSLFIENKNLKRLFETAKSLGFLKVNVGFVISLNFDIGNNTKVILSKDTFADNILEMRYKRGTSLTKIEEILEKNKIKVIDREGLLAYLEKKDLVKEDMFDKFGSLNQKIRKYGEMIGIDVLSNTRSLRNRIKNFSNDYSLYEDWFTKITGGDIGGIESAIKNRDFFKPVSIVIPCFNSNDTILKSLYSIESQSLSKGQKKLIDVVIVDDGSKEPVFELIEDSMGDFSFDLKVVRIEKNSGLSNARNVGIFCCKSEHLILMDSDILLPRNYILEHSIRNQLIPQAVFVSLKKNIENDSRLADVETIRKGLESPTIVDDLRIFREVKPGQPGLHKTTEETTIEILNETDYFKKFGFGRTIGAFDLATMTIGHNLSTRRKTLDKCKYFSRNFTGWGLEDSYFGAKIVANGNFVIPVLSSNVYHIDHSPRSGSEEAKKGEFKKNIEIYNKLLDEEF